MLGRVFSLSFHAERRDIYMYGGDEKDRNRSFYLGNQSKKKNLRPGQEISERIEKIR